MSIINEALKKVQRSLDQKDASLPLLEQKPSQAASPEPPKAEPAASAAPLKTLATIEQEQKEKELELKKMQPSMAQKRSSPFKQLLSTCLFICFCGAVFAFFYFSGHFKKIPFFEKFPNISTVGKSLNQKIASFLHKSSPSKPATANPSVGFGPASSAVSPERESSSAKKTSSVNFVLKGIVTKDNHPVALINDGIYEEGSTIEGVRVSSISSREVKLLDGDQTITLKIEGERR